MATFQSSSKASETGTNEDSNFKDDDDDDDNDEDEKVPPGSNIDPEKLKSFNVRASGIKHRPGKLKSFNVCAQVVIKMCTTTTVL